MLRRSHRSPVATLRPRTLLGLAALLSVVVLVLAVPGRIGASVQVAALVLEDKLHDAVPFCEIRVQPTLVAVPDGVRIIFETNCNGTASVTVNDVLLKVTYVRLHEAHHLYAATTPITPGKHYAVVVEWNGYRRLSDFTVPAATQYTTISLSADSHLAPASFAELCWRIGSWQPSLNILLGDFVSRGGDVELWESQLFSPLSSRHLSARVPTIFVRGNHDDAAANVTRAYLGDAASFGFRWGPAFFVVLSHGLRAEDGEKLLRRELLREDAKDAAVRIALVHVPPFLEYVSGSDDNEINPMPHIQEQWLPIMLDHGVDLVVSGHSHVYQRGSRDGKHFFAIIGGGGSEFDYNRVNDWQVYNATVLGRRHAVRVTVDDDALNWQARDIGDDKIIDSFAFNIAH